MFRAVTWGIHMTTTMWHRRCTKGDRPKRPAVNAEDVVSVAESRHPDQAEIGGEDGLEAGLVARQASSRGCPADLGGPPVPEPAVSVGGRAPGFRAGGALACPGRSAGAARIPVRGRDE